LVACILSQHTSDRNSQAAFESLRRAFPSWEMVLAAQEEQVAAVIRNGGLANRKAALIQGCLSAIWRRTGALDLGFLREMDDNEAGSWLQDLPGVGPKTAAIVLSFSLGRDVVAVDTHVFRVGGRLGFYDPNIGPDRAHRVFAEITPSGMGYRTHMALIVHGRLVCKAGRPRCEACPVADLCPGRVL
jgi:endonuclease-3